MELKQASKSNNNLHAESKPQQQYAGAESLQSETNGGMLQLKTALADPAAPLSPSQILQFQKSIGNRAVTQLMKSRNQQTSEPIQKKDNSNGMPDSLQSGLENLSGMDLSDVNVHYNSDKPAQLQALAYAQGNDIHIGAGQEQHLPHEGWHVVQQRQGRVAQTSQTSSGMALNDNASLEQEADQMGARANAFTEVDGGTAKDAPAASASTVIQQRLPEMTDEFITGNTEMAREILLHGLANMSSGEREVFVAEVNSTREAAIDYEKLRGELAIADASELIAWSPYILLKTKDSKKFTSTVELPDTKLPNPDEMVIINASIVKIIEGLGQKYNDAEFIKSIFGPTVDVGAVSAIFINIWTNLYNHQEALTSPVVQSSEKEHDEWAGVGGMAKAGAENVTFSSNQYAALLTGTPESLAVLVHEYSHVANGSVVDHAYSLDDMAKLTTKQRTENAETYAQAFLQMWSAPNDKRLYVEENVVKTEASVSDAPNDHLKRRMKAIKSNLTAMWSITDDAYLSVKKLKKGEVHASIKQGLVDVAAYPHVVEVDKDHVRLQALLEDRSKRYTETKNKLVAVLKAGGVTKEMLSDEDYDDDHLVPLATALAIQNALNLSDSNATQLVKGMLELKALKG